MQEPRHLVAVYGTLKSGYRLNKYINQTGTTTFITNGFLNANIYTNGSFPAIKTGEDKVFCEIYEVDSYTLDIMDYLESNGSLYQRRISEVFIKEDSHPIYAWTYFLIDSKSLKEPYWVPLRNTDKTGVIRF